MICVVTALNIPNTGAIGKCSNLGKSSTASVTSILENIFGSEVVMITDHEKSIHKFAVEHGIPVIQVAKGDKDQHINNITSLQSKLREMYKQYKGISTKHLENYIALGIFEHINSKLSNKEKVDKLLNILHNEEEPVEYSDIKRKKYPAFFYQEEPLDLAIDNGPNIYISDWDVESINRNHTKPIPNIEDKIGLLSDKNDIGFVMEEEIALFNGPTPF